MRLMHTMANLACLTVAGTMMGGVIAARAQNADPAARLAAATALMSMNQIDQRPWHLKLDVTVFDDKGKNPNQGTIEVWHAEADERTVYTFGDASRTSLTHKGKLYGASNGPDLPFEANEVLQEVEHPGPGSDDLSGSKPELREQKFGKVELDCIMLTQQIKGTGNIPLGLFPTYCLDATEFIRSTYNFGSQTVILNGIGKFLDHDVPTQLSIMNGQTVVASSKMTTLTTYTPQPDEFAPGANMVVIGNMARLAGGVVAGNRLSFVQPLYPDSMKAAHVSGTVILRAIIGRDGRIHSLRPTNATDPEFVISAIAAVRHWTYKPYTLNGVPTEVDTTITVNFAIN